MFSSNIFIKGLLYILLPTSLMIVLSANNWLFMWIGLELNMLSFIPLMTNSSKFQESDAMIKYFLIQALGSSILLMTSSILWSSKMTWIMSLLISTSMIMKLGMVPCHMWFPTVMSSISWWSCLILSSIQKLAPLSILMSIFMSNMLLKLMLVISIMNALTGGMIGMTQSKLKSIMAFSSITHMGWMMSAKLSFMPFTGITYLIMYSILITPIFLFMSSTSIMFSHQLSDKSSFSFNKSMMIPTLLLSLGGLPPLMGFTPKWMMIMLLNPNFMLLLLLILGSMMNLYFYLNILFNSTLIQNFSHKMKFYSETNSLMLLLFSGASIMLLPSFSLLFM